MQDFDDDLRIVLKMAGCKGERVAFIMDESNILDASFLERMNTLLANGEVPGLYQQELHSLPGSLGIRSGGWQSIAALNPKFLSRLCLPVRA